MNVLRPAKIILFVLIMFMTHFFPVNLTADKMTLNLTKNLVIGKNSGDNNFIFSSISDIDLDESGNIYILDSRDYRIQKFDDQGALLDSFTLSKGQGPEDVSFFPILAVTPEGEMAVLDRMARKILIFNIDGSFKRFFTLDFQPIDLEFYAGNTLAVLGLNKEKIIHIFDLEGKHIQSFGDPFAIPKKLIQYKDMPSLKLPNRFDSTQDGTLYLLNPHKYEIFVYTGGTLTKKIAGKNELYNPLRITQSSTGGVGIMYPAMFACGQNDSLFVTIQGPGMDPVNQMEYFEKGKSLFSQIQKGFPYAIDKSGRIYIAEAEDFPVMARYTIVN